MVEQNYTVFVGIDIGATLHVAAILQAHNVDKYRTAKTLEFENGMHGLLKLQSALDRASRNHDDFKIVLEPTGRWYPAILLTYLRQQGYAIYYVNNGAVANYAAAHNVEVKSDQMDSRMLAHMASAITSQTVYGMRPVPEVDCITGELQELARLHHRIGTARTADLNRLHQSLKAYFPDLEKFFRQGVAAPSCRQLLQAFPTPAALVEAGAERVSALLRRYGATSHAKRTGELIALAQAARTMAVAPSLLTRQVVLLQKIQEYDRTLARLKADLQHALQSHPSAPIFASFPGYGLVSAATLAGVIVDIMRYPNARAFRRAMGWAPKEKTSGKSRPSARLCHGGSRDARRVVFLWVFALIHKKARPNGFSILYKRLLARGKKRLPAIGHVCGEMLTILYSCLKHSTHYDAQRHYLALGKPWPPDPTDEDN